jgi:hypothetical protein
VYTKDQLAELFFHEISGLCQAAGMTESEQRSASRDLVEAAVSLPSKEHLMVAEIREGELVQLLHYDPVAALRFLASSIGGLIEAGSLIYGEIGASNLIALACTAIACFACFKGLKHTASRAEGALFLAVYESRYHIASRKEAEERFAKLCESEGGVGPEDFGAALQGLLDLDCIKESNGNLIIRKPVIMH